MSRPAKLLGLLFAGAALACAGAPTHSPTYGARKAMAEELVHSADWPRAFSVVDGLYREDPTDVEVLSLRGSIYREQHLLKEAEADFDEALRRNPKAAFAHSGLALVLELEGRGEEALDHHRRAAELDPKNAGYLNNLGFSLFAHGQAREAVPVFREALRLDPANPRLRNNLGFAYAKTGDFAQAAENFELAGAPAEAKNNLGYAYQAARNFAQAFDLYVEALRLDPGLSRARQNLIQVANRLGRPLPPDLAQEPRS